MNDELEEYREEQRRVTSYKNEDEVIGLEVKQERRSDKVISENPCIECVDDARSCYGCAAKEVWDGQEDDNDQIDWDNKPSRARETY